MQRSLALFAGTAALIISTSAQAQEFAQGLCDNAADAGGVIDPITLRSTALAGVTTDTLDYDHDGEISGDEMFLSLTTDAFNFCTVRAENAAGRATACGEGQEDALREAGSKLNAFWAQKGALYDLTVIAPPAADDLADRPTMNDRPYAPLLDERRRFVTIKCRGTGANAVSSSAAALGTGTVNGGKGGAAFLLGKDIDSLTVARTGEGRDRLSKVTPAEISFVSDNAGNSSTFAIDAVAGLRLADTARFKFTPFLQYSRSEVRDREKDETKLTGKFAVGAVSTVILGWDQFDLTPLYARDLENKAQLLTARVAWRPGFLYREKAFNNAYHFACPRTAIGACEFGKGLAIWIDFQVIGSFGTVLAEGTDPTFSAGKDYIRIGPSGAVHIYGLSGLVEDMSLDLRYKRLFSVSGDTRPVYAFGADINYWVAGSEHVSLTTGYERARDEETLKLTDEWKVALGIRF